MGKVRKTIFDAVTNKTVMKNLIIPFSFSLPVIILYLLYPASFQTTWKGRALYVFFLWLVGLELTLSWRKLTLTLSEEFKWPRTLAIAAFSAAPTIYVIAFFASDLNQLVVEMGRFLGVPFGGRYGDAFLQVYWPLSFEYMIFAVCFSASILLMYRKEGVRKFPVALFFIWAVAAFYMIDTFFPYGTIWVLQVFVPFTARSSATILNWIGYKTAFRDFTDPFYGPGTVLSVIRNNSSFVVIIFWPSAGVHSIIIYSVTILLFIKDMATSVTRKAIVFAVGAAGTFLANVWRIVTICTIGINVGSSAAKYFHDYYGELFFISWMLAYLGIIFFGPKIAVKTLKVFGRRPEKSEEKQNIRSKDSSTSFKS